MSTRTYDRNTLEWEQEILDVLVQEGDAKPFVTPKGTHYVVKIGNQSFGVRPEQVVGKPDPLANIPDPDDLEFLRGIIVDHDSDVDYRVALQKKADEAGVSIEEFTDGEYTTEDGIVVSLETVRRREDDLLSKFL